MKRPMAFSVSLAVLLSSVVGLGTLFATPGFTIRYEIIDVGTLGGLSSNALGINDKGQVVGAADGPGGRLAYLWENGVMIDLGNIGEEGTHEAWDINENSVIVGIVTPDGSPEDSFIWEDGVISELGPASIPRAALAINDAEQVVGTAIFPPSEGGGQRAFLLEDGVLTDLTTAGFCSGTAWDINTQGHVVGGPCLWRNGEIVELGTLGGQIGGANSINDLDQIVGISERNTFDGLLHAFLWEDGVMTDLGLIVESLGPFSSSHTWAINNPGQVVGHASGQVALSSVAGFVQEGFLFDPITGAVLLRDTLPEGSGWSRIVPRDINDNGQIVGTANTPDGFRHGFLMTPLPPIPATSPMLLFALATGVLVAAYVLIARRTARSPAPTDQP